MSRRFRSTVLTLVLAALAVAAVAAPASAGAAGLTVTITKQPAAETQARTATFAWTVRQGRAASKGATLVCTLDGKPQASCKSPKAFRALKDGRHSFKVLASKVVRSRTLTGSDAYVWLVDNSDPSTPTLSGATADWRADAATFTARATDLGSLVERYESQVSADGGATWTGLQAGATRTVATAGTSMLRFRAVDGAGNAGAFVTTLVRIDQTVPSVPTVSGGSTAWASLASRTITANSSDSGSGVNRLEFQTSTDGGATWTVPSTGSATTVGAEGSTLVRFRAFDNVGRVSDFSAVTDTSTVRLDRTAPPAPGVSGGNGATEWQSIVGLDLVAVAADATSGVVDYQVRTSTDGGATYGAFTPVGVLGRSRVSAEGHTLVQFRAVDAAGNVGATSADTDASETFIDRTLPEQPVVTGPVGPIDGTHAVTGTSTDALSGIASLTLTYAGPSNTTGTVCTVTAAAATSFSCAWNTTSLARGTYTLTATAADRAGNVRAGTRVITLGTAALVVTETGGATSATEGAATDSYGLALATQPTSDVTVTIAGTTQVAAAPTTYTFTPANWATAQTVVVTAVNDLVDETSPLAAVVSHTLASTDGAYSGLAAPSVSVGIVDNDVAALDITATGGTSAVTEGSTIDTIDVKLATQPTAPVTVAVSGDSQVGVTAGSALTFNATNWNTAQVVTFEATDDAVDDDIDGVLTFNPASVSDAFYDALPNATRPVTVTDNDTAGVDVVKSGGTTVVSESGTTDSYTVALTSKPVANVVVTLDNGTQLAPHAALTFTPADWNAAQTVIVTATDDAVAEASPHAGTIASTVTSTDPKYTGFAVADQAVAITDNDTAGFTATPNSGLVATEAGGQATVQVVLTSQPTQDVTITATGDSQLTAITTSRTFTSANWSTAQAFTIGAVDDADVDPAAAGTVTLTASSTDGFYPGTMTRTVTGTATDNDTAGFAVVDGGSTSVAEAGTTSDSFTIALTSRPDVGKDVVVTPVVDTTQLTLTSSTPLTFTNANWATAQTVTVSAVDDSVDEDISHVSSVSFTTSTLDPDYAALTPAPVSVSIADNDTAGVVLTPVGTTSVTEGSLAVVTYAVALTSKPSATVTVAIGNANPGQLTTNPTSLSFSTIDWATPKNVTVSAVDDALVEGSKTYTLTHTATSADPGYGFTGPSRTVQVIDNDANYIVAGTLDVAVTEAAGAAHSDTFDVQLSTQPLNNVVITVTNPDAEVTSTPSSLTFTPADWDQVQHVTVTAVDDNVDEDPVAPHIGRTTLTASSADLNYNSKTADVDASVTDNDTRGITVVTNGGGNVVDEASTANHTDTYSVVLDSQPTGSVSLALAGTQVTAATSPVVFTTANWNVPQDVTVTAIDDHFDEADTHPGSVAYTVTGGDYAGFVKAATPVTVNDDDTRGVTLTPAGGDAAVNETGLTTDTYDVTFDSEPKASTTVTLSSAGVTVTPATLTFDSTNWNVAHTVTVQAKADSVDQGLDYTASVGYVLSGAGSDYAGFAVTPTSVTVTDNDTASLVVTPTSLSVTEGAAGSTYTVKLGSEPTVDTTVTVGGSNTQALAFVVAGPVGNQVTSSPSTLTFTAGPAGTWKTAQTVTVTAIDDAVDEDTDTVSVTNVATAGDPRYTALSSANVTATITDNDAAALDVVESSGTTVSEPATTDTFTVKLHTKPTAAVRIDASGSGQASISPASYTIQPADWNSPVTFTVTATNDDVDEVTDPAAQVFTLVSSSTDSKYGSLTGTVTASVTDDDTAAVIHADTGGSTQVIEGGASDTVAVKLATQPTADVIVTPSVGIAEITVDTTPLTFTTSNWNVAQNVAVTAVNDDDDDNTAPGSLVLTASSPAGDVKYPGLTATKSVPVVDNDSVGVVLNPASPALAVSEAGLTSDTFTVKLTSRPAASTTVNFASTLVGVTTSVTFSRTDWMTPQTVTVTALSESVDQGPSYQASVAISLTGSSDYAGLSVPAVPVTVTDDDTAGFTLVESGGTTLVRENGLSDSYSIRLNSQPLSNVTITTGKTAPNSGRLNVTPVTLTFTPGNWSTPQNVNVAAVNDLLAQGTTTTTTTHTVSGDPQYAPLTPPAGVAVTVEDNDAAVLVSKSTLSIAEAGTTSETYSLVLTTRPTSSVTVSIGVDIAQVTRSVPSVVFTAGNWDQPQTVTITANDDLIDEANPHTTTVTHASSSADLNYNGVPAVASVIASIADDDTAGYDVSATPTSVTEGSAGQAYTLKLRSQPTGNVTITPTADADATFTPTALVFTPGDWNQAQTITVAAFDDAVDELDEAHTLAFTTTTSDTSYATAPPSVGYTVVDNDTRDVVVNLGNGLVVSENPAVTDTFTIVLGSQPTADVTVAFGSTQVTAPTATFTPANWNQVQTITVTAIDDKVDEADPHAGTIAYTISGGDYGTVTEANSSVSVGDDDTAGYIRSALPGTVTEGGSDSYTVQLSSQPIANVVITPAADPDLSYAPASLTFTSGNWNVPQTITVTGVDDAVDEDSEFHTFAFSNSSTDPKYQVAPSDGSITVNDNDTAAVNAVISAPNTVVTEGGTGDDYTVVLGSQPTSNVTVTATADAQTRVATAGAPTPAGTATLTFTSGTWNVPQTVNVSAFNDTVPEGPHTGTITNAATSSDPKYTGLTVASIPVIVNDNDGAVLVVQSGGSTAVSEAAIGTTDSYDVKLTTPPSAPVTITLTHDGQIATDKSTLVFDNTNWNVAQTVTVSAVQDAVDEASPQTSTILHTSASTDASYDASHPVPSVQVAVTDNDTSSVLVSTTSVSVSEAGATSTTYGVSLGSEPVGTVTVTPATVGGQVTVSGPLTFDSTNYATVQNVTVTAVNDDDAEANPHTATITNAVASSTDAFYPSVTAASVTASIADNDVVGVTVDDGGGVAVTEGGATDSFTVRLNSRPTGTVTVTISGSETQVTRSTSTLTFDRTTWNVAQAVTVTAVNDLVDESPHPAGSFAFAITGADYNAVAHAALPVAITDNDVAGVTFSKTSVQVSEAGVTDSYTVKLNTQPAAPVDVNLAGSPDVTLSSAVLHFTTANWATAQTVTVTAVDNGVAEGDHTQAITHTETSTDAHYSGHPLASVTANIENNDPAVLLTNTAGKSVSEAGTTTDTYMVRLASEPTQPVTVTSSATPSGQVAFSTPLTFNGDTWRTPQPVTITALDDSVVEGAQTVTINTVATSVDANYNNRPATTFTASVVDDDTPGVTKVGAGALAVTEATGGSHTATFTVRLAKTPSTNVTVDLSPSADITVNAATLTFTPGNASTPQSVTVTGVDDALVEASPETATLGISSTTPGYTFTDSVNVAVTDNDVPGITVASAPTTLAEGGSDTFTVVLDRQPVDNVTVTFTDDAESDVTSPGSKSATFTPADWNQAQTFTVVATEDGLVDGTTSSTLTPTVTSAGRYNGYSLAPITFGVTDGNSVAVVLSGQDSLDLVEGGFADTFTVRLNSAPTSDVTVSFANDGQAFASGSATFTSSTWKTAQTITVTAVNDTDVETSPHAGVFTVSVTGAAPYSGMTVPGFSASITDNDVAPGALVISDPGASGVHLVRDGANVETVQVKLSRQPSVDVTITVARGNMMTADTNLTPTTLTFTTTDWNVDQAVTMFVPTTVPCTGGSGGPGSYFVGFSAAGGDFAGVTASLDGDVVNGAALHDPCV
ncbi:MAG: hypothetical protein JWP31_479 [Aeromicrobium sp.]|nr:hypothetical protein [Aeromicrobium sp.]